MLEDSTSGLCHTPGTRAGLTPLVGSNPTSSAAKNPVQRKVVQGFIFAYAYGRFQTTKYTPILMYFNAVIYPLFSLLSAGMPNNHDVAAHHGYLQCIAALAC